MSIKRYEITDKNILKRRLLIIMENKKYKQIAITLLTGAIVLAGANLFGFQPISAFDKNNKNINISQNTNISKRYIGNWKQLDKVDIKAIHRDDEPLSITEKQLLPFIDLAEKELHNKFNVSISEKAELEVSARKTKDVTKISLLFNYSTEYYNIADKNKVPMLKDALYVLEFTNVDLENGTGVLEYSLVNDGIDRNNLKNYEDKASKLFKEQLGIKFNPKDYQSNIDFTYSLNKGKGKTGINMVYDNGKNEVDKDYLNYKIYFSNVDLSTGKGDVIYLSDNMHLPYSSTDITDPAFTKNEKQSMKTNAEKFLKKIGIEKTELLATFPYSYGKNIGHEFYFSFINKDKTELISIAISKDGKVKEYDLTVTEVPSR